MEINAPLTGLVSLNKVLIQYNTIKSIKRKNGKIDFVILALYVDDILWFSNNTGMLKKEKEALAKRFKVDDMGEVSYVLGMSVKRNRETRTLMINQPKYLEGVLKRNLFQLHWNQDKGLSR